MIRVRQALADGSFRQKLRYKIPKEALVAPEDLKAYYPSSFLKSLPEDNQYSYLGIITENLLRYNEEEVAAATLKKETKIVCGIDVTDKVLKAKATVRYLENVKATIRKLHEIVGNKSVAYEKEVAIRGCNIMGHPDIMTDTDIFEVKTSGQLKTSWTQFLLQTFCYAALCPTAKRIHLVLPLQEHIWTWDVSENWSKRSLFLDIMKSFGLENEQNQAPKATKKKDGPKGAPKSDEADEAEEAKDEQEEPDFLNPDSSKMLFGKLLFGQMLFSSFPIGMHIPKKKTVALTLQSISNPALPVQIFFTARGTKFTIKDSDIADSLQLIQDHNLKVFIHAPYLLNLCKNPDDGENYVVDCLKKHLEVGSALGAKGVVVHVGKYVNAYPAIALEYMRRNITACLESATPECPLLLETPAGQGTEMLKSYQEFTDFTQSFKDPRFGICVDTCHVFATGQNPLKYIVDILAQPQLKSSLKLIHFNDSKGACGSCVDRHAMLGTGCLNQDMLTNIAVVVSKANIPMLVE